MQLGEARIPKLDIHVHAVGTGRHGSGCSYPGGGRYRLLVPLMTKAFGMPLRALSQDFDGLYIERLVQYVQESSLDAVVLLALDRPRRDNGKALAHADSFQVPNDWVLELAAQHPELLPGVSIHPAREDALEELERCLERGAALVKLVPSCQNIDCASPRAQAFWRRMAEAGLPLLAHTGSEHALEELRPEWGRPRILEAPLRAGVTTIAAHCGGEHQEEFLAMLKEFPHLYGDTAAFNVPLGHPPIDRLVADGTVERILHGSDQPVPVSALGWWKSGHLPWRSARRLDAIANPVERDYQIKRALGFPEGAFTRAGALLRGAEAGSVAR